MHFSFLSLTPPPPKENPWWRRVERTLMIVSGLAAAVGAGAAAWQLHETREQQRAWISAMPGEKLPMGLTISGDKAMLPVELVLKNHGSRAARFVRVYLHLYPMRASIAQVFDVNQRPEPCKNGGADSGGNILFPGQVLKLPATNATTDSEGTPETPLPLNVPIRFVVAGCAIYNDGVHSGNHYTGIWAMLIHRDKSAPLIFDLSKQEYSGEELELHDIGILHYGD